MNKLNIFTFSLLYISTGNLLASTKINHVNNDNKKEKKEIHNKTNPRLNFFKRFQQMHEAFEQDMQEMFKMHEQMFNDFFTDDEIEKKQVKKIKTIKISKETDKNNNKWVTITVELPESTKKSDIKIKAKGNNLEGILDSNDHKLKFYIAHGREFGTSLEYKITSDKKQKNAEQKEETYQSLVESYSSHTTIIPYVANLEKAIAYFEGSNLVIKLPSFQPKQDWANIEVSEPTKEVINAEQNNVHQNLK